MDKCTQNLEVFIKKRDIVKSKLRIFKSYVEKVKDRRCNSETPLDAVEICGLEQRIERIDSLLIEFDEIQEGIDCVTENAEEQFLVREEFEEFMTALLPHEFKAQEAKKQRNVPKPSSSSDSG
ncbi:hypothetical protein ILUMI_26178 [Ignelater luminosus]|uniref:Uncharacterized protein n=1 Tax=Ignelater luminosus TaxID=2038154 RepID=A0A8K0FW04_IGNLU|nr:hypothetical protein ILUMI_26178 [Ignelater luminosus]